VGPYPCDLQLTTFDINGHPVIAVAGEIDVCSAPVMHACLRQAADICDISADGGHDLVVDLSAVTFMDASGLSVLLRADHRARRAGRRLRVAAPTPAISRLLQITLLDSYFDLYPTSQAATARPRRTVSPAIPPPVTADQNATTTTNVTPPRTVRPHA
jgi:anti-sigma B factor antagonist